MKSLSRKVFFIITIMLATILPAVEYAVTGCCPAEHIIKVGGLCVVCVVCLYRVMNT